MSGTSNFARFLATAAGAAAAHAFVATAVADHDGAADVARGSVSHIDHAGERVGGMDGTSSGRGRPSHTGIDGAVEVADTFGGGPGLGAQVVEEQLLLSAEEAQVQPAEDVIHDGLGKADIGIAGPAAGLEAHVLEFFAEQAQRYAMLERDRDGEGEAVHEAGDGRAFLGHLDEELARISAGIESDGDVALVASDVELVGDRHALFFQAMTHGARRSVGVVVW